MTGVSVTMATAVLSRLLVLPGRCQTGPGFQDDNPRNRFIDNYTLRPFHNFPKDKNHTLYLAFQMFCVECLCGDIALRSET